MNTNGHVITCGATRQGKSKLTMYAILKSFEINQPVCYIDPKGDTYPAILANFFKTKKGAEYWEKYKHKIIFINPTSKSNYIVGFNAIQPINNFAHAEVDKVAYVANSTMAHILRESGFAVNEANRMRGIMSAAIGMLVEGGHGKLTLAELPILFKPYFEGRKLWTYNPMVKKLLGEIDHFGIRSFWQNQWNIWTANDRREWVQSTLGRIQPFLFDERFLYTTCTSENATLDFNEIVNKGYWVFVNLNSKLLTEPETTLLGSLIISKIFTACMQRDNNRVSYRLIVDEARLLNTAPLDEILETSGAYNLWLSLIVQDLNQLYRPTTSGRDYHLRDTALNNADYIYSFRVDVTDARLLAERMFNITGTVLRGTRVNGEPDYLPPQAEEAEYIRVFKSLPARAMILYNKRQPDDVKVKFTPTLELPDATQEEVNYFEAQHMKIIGRPAQDIRKEIDDRQRKWTSLLHEVTSQEPIYDQTL